MRSDDFQIRFSAKYCVYIVALKFLVIKLAAVYVSSSNVIFIINSIDQDYIWRHKFLGLLYFDVLIHFLNERSFFDV